MAKVYLLLHKDSPGNNYAEHLLDEGIEIVTWQSSGDEPHVHASVLVDVPKRQIIEALYPVVHTRELDLAEFPYIDVIEVTGVDEAAVVAFLQAQIGKPYGTVDLFHFITEQEDKNEGASYFCSRLGFSAFATGGKPLFARCPSFKVSPGLLFISTVGNYVGTLADLYKQIAKGNA